MPAKKHREGDANLLYSGEKQKTAINVYQTIKE
jgi:hypothetical protein